MGKRLILKGADFSDNGFPVHNYQWANWYNNFEGEVVSTSNNKTYIIPSEIVRLGMNSLTVKCVYLYASQDGVVGIGEATPGDTPSYDKEHTYTVTQGMNLIELDEPVTLDGSNSIYVIGFGVFTLNGKVGSDVSKGWLFAASGTTGGTSRIPIAFGTF